jgi:tRNA threonylcarbamoyladenosine biosynthesis protein TsaB
VNVLAIDTSGEAMGVALATREGRLLCAVQRAGLRHAEALAPAIATILAQGGVSASSLDLVACCIGPGSFTGVRIGMATAKGLAVGAGCGVVGVPSLDALASRFAAFPAVAVPVIDARKGRLYAAAYRGGERLSEYLDLEPLALGEMLLEAWRESLLVITGPYARQFEEILRGAWEGRGGKGTILLDRGFSDSDPLAVLELGIGRFRSTGADPEALAPLYLRSSEAEIRNRSAPAAPAP